MHPKIAINGATPRVNRALPQTPKHTVRVVTVGAVLADIASECRNRQ